MTREKLFLSFDRAITASLCILIFCLPMAKAGIGIFTGLAFLFWVAKRVLGYRTNGGLWGMIPKTELNKVLGAYIIINALSVILSVDYGLSLRGFFCKELKFIALCFMIVEVINSKQRLKSILFTIIASAALIAADAGVQYFRGIDFLKGYAMHYDANGGRITASFPNPNGFAGWLIITIPLFFGLLATNKIIGKTVKALLAILTALLFICLLMTFSRAAWVGFIISIFIIVCHYLSRVVPKIKMMPLFLGIYVLAAFLCFPEPIKIKIQSIVGARFSGYETLNERIKSVAKIDHITNLIRVNFWKESFKIIKDYPLSGSGLNTYSKVVKDYKNFEYVEYGEGYPHNSFLQKTTETGIPGLLSFLLVIFSFFITSIQHIFYAHKNNNLLVGFSAGIAAFLVQSLFDNNLYALQLVVLFWFMLGLAIAVNKLENEITKNIANAA